MVEAPSTAFQLRVVPIDQVLPHEEVDPARVSRLVARLEQSQILFNPPIVSPSSQGLVLLDGATRTDAIRSLGLGHLVVQVVTNDQLQLGTWHHVVRGIPSPLLQELWEQNRCLQVHTETKNRPGPGTRTTTTEETPIPDVPLATIVFPGNVRLRLVPAAGVGWTTAMAEIVAIYRDDPAVISRTRETDPTKVQNQFPDMGALVQFSALSWSDVLEAAISSVRLPAGITRFVIPGRVLRVGFPLSVLGSDLALEQKQKELDSLIDERAKTGRVRHYTEPVYILDD